MEPRELVKVQTYLRKVFGAKTLSVRARPKIKDSAEVYVGDEFIGTLTREDESLAGRYVFCGGSLVSFQWQEGGAIARSISAEEFRGHLDAYRQSEAARAEEAAR